MRFPISYLAFGVSAAIAAVGPAAAADVEAGKTTFKKCALCHTTEAGKNKIGPSLFGIVGRKSASLDNYQLLRSDEEVRSYLGRGRPSTPI